MAVPVQRHGVPGRGYLGREAGLPFDLLAAEKKMAEAFPSRSASSTAGVPFG